MGLHSIHLIAFIVSFVLPSSHLQACVKVCRFMNVQTERIRSCLDGKNLESVLGDLGERFHRVIYEHLQQFQYNSMGSLIIRLISLLILY